MSSYFTELWSLLGGNVYILILCGIFFLYHLIVVIYKSVLITSREKGSTAKEGEGISVIITSNNRAEELKENLCFFLEQDYPDFEVIVVDECSEDNTQEVLAEMQQKYPHLRTTRIFPETKFRSTKKIAINIGILAARHDILLFSEIDCRPASNEWIKNMQSYFTPDTAVVLGYANYPDQRKGMGIRRGIRFMRFLKMFLLIKAKCYVSGDGRNMGYRKKFYISKRGFSRNSQSYIGYANEMVNVLSGLGKVKVAKKENTFIIINDDKKKTWKEDSSYYYINKRRWPVKAWLRAEIDTIIRTLLYIFLFFLLFKQIFREYIIACILLTFLIGFITINIYLKHLKQKKLFLISLFVSSVGFLYRWYYNIYSIFTSKKWR